MRVLIVTQYFPPETGGPQNRMASFAAGLASRGHSVRVIAPVPSYPEGVVYEDFRKWGFHEREFSGVPVTHTPVWSDPHKSFVGRLLYFASFVMMAVVGVLKNQESFDVVLASSPPLTVGIAGWIASVVKRARFLFDVRDLWPDVAVALNELPEGLPAKAARSLERFIYARADAVTAVTRAFCQDVKERAPERVRVAYIPNGTTPSKYDVENEPESIRKQFGLPSGFLTTYAGNVGLAQGLGIVLDSAELLRDDGGYRFLILGEGAAKSHLVQRARERRLDSVVFHPRVTQAEASLFMAASDALLVTLADDPIYQKFVPSKLYDCMAVGRPILLTVDGEARTILGEAGAGVFCPPGDPRDLAAAVRRLKENPEARRRMGRRGKRYVAAHYSRDAIASRLAELLAEISGASSTEAANSDAEGDHLPK